MTAVWFGSGCVHMTSQQRSGFKLSLQDFSICCRAVINDKFNNRLIRQLFLRLIE